MPRPANKTNVTWPPDWLPDALLGPDQEPVISMEELLTSSSEESAIMYYRRSGRFLGEYPDKETAAAADPYRYVRSLLGGILPWERSDGQRS
jgi:hypothetical protein